MGARASKVHSANDFELVIRSAKELEHILSSRFGASGNGVNDMLDSLNAGQENSEFSTPLVKRMRHLIWTRNQLVHDYDFNQIPNRTRFIDDFEKSVEELQVIIKKREGKSSDASSCVIC